MNWLIFWKHLYQFLLWIGKSFNGANGQPSSRRLLVFSIFFICYAIGRLVFIFTCDNFIYQLYGCVLDATFILVLYGIVNVADIAAIKNGVTPEQKPKKDENNI
ncbi:MAG TPA: hypothetical protein VD905_06270 [Flavobacteriales bacterium]|nr:hypothetical protein [Flavobacteriales bacterium]